MGYRLVKLEKTLKTLVFYILSLSTYPSEASRKKDTKRSFLKR